MSAADYSCGSNRIDAAMGHSKRDVVDFFGLATETIVKRLHDLHFMHPLRPWARVVSRTWNRRWQQIEARRGEIEWPNGRGATTIR